MADLEKLQKMAKNGEFSKKLLEDENFKAELKKILKEECKIEITDEDIPEIVKNLEENLKENPDDAKVKQILSEEEVENVSGGISKAKIIKSISTIACAALGAGLGHKTGRELAYMYNLRDKEVTDATDRFWSKIENIPQSQSENSEQIDWLLKQYEKENPEDTKIFNNSNNRVKYASKGGALVGGAGGAGAGYWLSNYICNKFDIK